MATRRPRRPTATAPSGNGKLPAAPRGARSAASHDLVTVGDTIGDRRASARRRTRTAWWIWLPASGSPCCNGAGRRRCCTSSTSGVGIWGINVPVAWGFAIVNFVWWIGIGHAGTLISAILLLMHQKWRTSINRFAEAMTIFAVMCAGMFPLIHMGRPWFFYWLYPVPELRACGRSSAAR